MNVIVWLCRCNSVEYPSKKMSKSDAVGKAKSKVSKQGIPQVRRKKTVQEDQKLPVPQRRKNKLKQRNNTKKSNGQSTQIKFKLDLKFIERKRTRDLGNHVSHTNSNLIRIKKKKKNAKHGKLRVAHKLVLNFF